jgi:predicted DNA-binding transcriptional regulator YafY
MLDTSARLLKLLTVLQRQRHWGGDELAGHLEITDRTLRRDVERLRRLGYEVDASSGPGGGYQLAKGTRLPPLVLDDQEAIAIAVALRSAADIFVGLSDTAMTALVKLEHLLPERLRRRVAALQSMTVTIAAGGGPRMDPDRLVLIASACRDCETLSFAYQGRDGRAARRTVEPLRLAHVSSRRWYLLAWDQAREDWRTFRVDRIEGAIERGARFQPRRPPKDAATYIEESLRQIPRPVQARVRLCAPASRFSGVAHHWGRFDAIDEKSCYYTTSAETIEGLACSLIWLGVEWDELEPSELVPALRQVGQRLLTGAPETTKKVSRSGASARA